ncbi:protein NETWORKED 3A-like [Bidens hawaiensis]|uniref:protein NETWORKED 3A-like n=1 Tax=Bidens hawaiensis TaxID=980011 RepID=UPI00404B216D
MVWWVESQNNMITRHSPWLKSTLEELDEKTGSMLNLIDQEADSFAKHAEMYYTKRPELIKLIEDSYLTQRALALHYDQAKKFGFNSTTFRPITDEEKSYDSYSDSVDLCHDHESNESETDDHQTRDEEVMNLREEIDRLKEENKIQKKMLVEKDEEKRQVIRQLSFCVDLIKQENLNLKKRCVTKVQINSGSIFSRVFWEKMFCD